MRIYKKIKGYLCTAASVAVLLSCAGTVLAAETADAGGTAYTALPAGEGAAEIQTLPAQTMLTFEPARFVLPEEARVLVVVEGMQGSNCGVYAFEKTEAGWEARVCTPGIMGRNGMSSHRTVGDKTTPVGLFRLNTPFGQGIPLEGFPEDYIRVGRDHVWSDSENRLVEDAGAEGEHVGRRGYAGHYEYVLDAGFNVHAIPGQGSALFLHCRKETAADTSGCVAIPKEQMIEIMRLYGTYKEGACYIAQAPAGGFDCVYDSYGANNGLSPVDEQR